MVVQQLMVQKGLRYRMYQELVPEARLRGISFANMLVVTLVLLSFLFLALETEPALNSQPHWQGVFRVLLDAVVEALATSSSVVLLTRSHEESAPCSGCSTSLSSLRLRWNTCCGCSLPGSIRNMPGSAGA